MAQTQLDGPKHNFGSTYKSMPEDNVNEICSTVIYTTSSEIVVL